jgi:hypothetical protein
MTAKTNPPRIILSINLMGYDLNSKVSPNNHRLYWDVFPDQISTSDFRGNVKFT